MDEGPWTIVGALGSIVAAVLAGVAVWQGWRVLKQAREQKHEAVAPDWEFLAWRVTSPESDHARGNHIVELSLRNVGSGPASNLSVNFTPSNGHSPYDTQGFGAPASDMVMHKAVAHRIAFLWDMQRPIDGTLTVSGVGRHGRVESRSFRLRTYVDGVNDCNGWAELTRLH